MGRSPCSPKSVPAPPDPASCGLGGLPPTPQCFLSVDSPCACSSTPVTSSLTSSVASLPKVTFLHSAARPVPGDRATRATCWWSLSSSQLGQREKSPRDSSCGAQGRASMWPQLTGFRCCRCPGQQDKKGSERQHQRPELVPGELALPPSRAPRVSVQAVPRLLSAVSRKWEEAESWRLETFCTTAFLQAPAASVHGLPPAQGTASREGAGACPMPGLGRADTRAAAAHTPAPSLSPGVWAASSTCDTHSKGNTGSSHVSVKQTWHRLQGAAARSAGDRPGTQPR